MCVNLEVTLKKKLHVRENYVISNHSYYLYCNRVHYIYGCIKEILLLSAAEIESRFRDLHFSEKKKQNYNTRDLNRRKQ